MQSNESNQPNAYMQAAHALNAIHLVDGAAGVVYWKPNGLQMYENLRSFIRKAHRKAGYLEVKSPSLAPVHLFEQSGHVAKYRDLMFFANQNAKAEELEGYLMRPMSCPNHIALYMSELRSYRELPLALFEFGEVYRNEPSGSLQVLFRQRQFCQDDSHVFVAQDGVAQGVANYLKMAKDVYKELQLGEIQVGLSLRPEQRFGDDALWDKAEEQLRQACKEANLEFNEQPGDGAFYGPKLELGVKDHRGRVWQMGVIQLDYVLPERFQLEYVNSNNEREQPVMLHHAVLGSMERMLGIMLEVHGVNLPKWLHPIPNVVVPVSEKKHLDFARDVAKAHPQEAIVDEQVAPLSAKIRHWRSKGVPNVLVVGDKEMQAHLDNPEELWK